MSKLRKKIVVPISLTLTGCLVVAAFVLNDSLTKVDANVAFNGISDIVSSHGKDKPFNIVEVVPDKKMASIGYLIDGQEPDDWFGTLSKMSDKEGDGVQKRADYMSGLKTKLAPITTEKKDNTKPLYYEPYEESYVSLDDDWSELALVDMDRINKGTTGYKMTEQAEGDYKFNTDYQLAVNGEGLPTGHYRQNVDHYVFMQGEDETEDGSESVDTGKRGYYSVAFTAVKLPDGMTNTQYLVETDNSQKADGNTDSGTDGNIDSSTDNTIDTGTGDDTAEKHVVYSIKSAYAIVSAEGMQNIAKYDPKAYIYRTDKSDTTSPYEFVARADRMASLPDGSKPDYEKYTYFTVEMEYVPVDKITDDETYYEVDTEVPIEFNYDETGEYGAVLDSQNPYEKIDDGTQDNQPAGKTGADDISDDASIADSATENNDGNTGRVILTDTDGYFDIVKDSQTYTYVGKGKGDYIMEADKNGSLDYPVNTTHIYYKGGFKNNNWFRTGVFNQEGKTGDDDKTANMTFKVKTVTPKELEQIDVSTIDLLYLSGSKSVLSNDLGDDAAKYNTGNDITWDKVKQIVQRVHQSGIMMPVIVDNGIVWASSPADYSSNIKKLAGLLSCNNFSSLNFTKDSADNFINWNDNNVITYYQVASSTRTHGYVVGNEYVIPRNYNPGTDVPFVLRDDFATAFIENVDETKFVEAAKNENFGEIAEYINSENTSRKNENNTLGQKKYEYYDKKISKAIVLSYIISYADKRDVAKPVDELNILDIEPGMNTGSVNNCINNLKNNLKSWLGSNCPAEDKINITCINSSEFIGRIEDLNNYDMIYMGLCADNLNWNNGRTVYNDSTMNGLIYSNVGDIVVIDPTRVENYNGNTYGNGHAGLLDSDYVENNDGTGFGLKTNLPNWNGDNGDNREYIKSVNTYRGSGNDITTEKVEALNNYLKAGYPIVLANGFYMNDNNTTVNEDKIDNCSNIYSFLNTNASNEYMLKVSSNNTLSKDLYASLTAEKPQIKVKEQKKEEDKDYVKLEDNHIVLEFSINNRGGADANASFDLGFYLDANADGKFSPTQEKIAGNNVQIYQDGTLVSPQLDANGEYYYNLNAGKYNYKLVYELPTQFVGVIPWQLRASQTTNSYRYDVTGGYFYKQANSNQKQHIKVLQINTSREKNNNYLFNGSTFNMQKEKENQNSKFAGLLKQVTDFELDITTLDGDSSEFKTLCKNDKVKDYDMLVIGFSDCYEIFNDSGQVDRIKEFIQSGKAVLFTHDTTSHCNNKNTDKDIRNNVWGYEFNTIVRDVVGMDRYGILNSSALKKGNTLKKGDADYNAAVNYANEHKTDIAYEPRTNKQTIVRQNQGFVYGDLSRYQNTGHGYHRLYPNIGDPMGNTNNAIKVNSGQITTYPFKISDNINISRTHRQYYQLDFNEDSDNDGESDIVVWYTLSNHDVYNVSPKDVRNNYYIYTKGNVTYSGVGHSNVTDSVDELKLYINTMIAAYSVVEHAPAISLKEGYDPKSADICTIYSTIDTAIQQDEEAKKESNPEEGNPDAARLDVDDDGNIATQDVYFTVKDTNMLRNQVDKDTTVNMSFFIEGTKDDHDKEIDDDGNTIYLKEMKNWQIYSLHDDGSEADLLGPSEAGNNRTFFANNTTYKVKVPLETLPAGQNSIKVYAVASSNITVMQNNQEVKKNTPEAYKTFQIQRVGLADLD